VPELDRDGTRAPRRGARHAPARRPLPRQPRQAVLAQGERQLAQEHLATVATMYREMGMAFWLEQAEALLGPFR
jgi:hypothetical protein